MARRFIDKFCVGCGICSAICPTHAISMKFDSKRGVCVPIVGKGCTNCGLCDKVCSLSAENQQSRLGRLRDATNFATFDLAGSEAFLAWENTDRLRRKSVSGGAITALALKLLREKVIAGVIHMECVNAKRGEPHYKVVISKSECEVSGRRGVAYEPLNFSEALQTLEHDSAYLIIGTPCVISTISKYEDIWGKKHGVRFIKFALVCSHNVSTLMADFMADKCKVPRKRSFFYNPRHKKVDSTTCKGSGFYHTFFFAPFHSFFHKDRFSSGWTKYWRSYCFALKPCLYCTDFWGIDADASFKDAWGNDDWERNPLGTSIVLFKNRELLDYAQSTSLTLKPLSLNDYAYTQYAQIEYKIKRANEKVNKSILSIPNIKNGLLKKTLCSFLSTKVYSCLGFKCTELCFSMVDIILNVIRKSKQILIKIKKHFGLQIKLKTILVAGGYGYGNVGDEAQCNSTLKLLTTRYPDYQIIDLTPNPNYSRAQHPGYCHECASRMMFFNDNCSGNIFWTESLLGKMFFILSAVWIYFNGCLVKHNLPVFFINSRKAWMLQELSQASLLYFCGGGYLTGATRTRLWDGVLLCRLCRLFGIPVVMSGQTLGIWKTRFNRILARWGFKYVSVIGTRDDSESIEQMRQIGFPGLIMPTHDDALFCDKSTTRQINAEKYIAYNFHFWGMNAEQRVENLGKIHQIIEMTKNKYQFCNSYFIPMTPSDLNAYKVYRDKFGNTLELYSYDFDFRKMRRAISDAELVVTMKHHPIIFAIGETVPVISIAFSEYYRHKNQGALGQYGLGEFSVDLETEDWLEAYRMKLSKVKDRATFQVAISERLWERRAMKENFLSHVDRVLRNEAGGKQ